MAPKATLTVADQPKVDRHCSFGAIYNGPKRVSPILRHRQLAVQYFVLQPQCGGGGGAPPPVCGRSCVGHTLVGKLPTLVGNWPSPPKWADTGRLNAEGGLAAHGRPHEPRSHRRSIRLTPGVNLIQAVRSYSVLIVPHSGTIRPNTRLPQLVGAAIIRVQSKIEHFGNKVAEELSAAPNKLGPARDLA